MPRVYIRVIYVTGLYFDVENEAKLRMHGVSVDEVQQVLDKWPRFYVNRLARRATHVMIGPPDLGGCSSCQLRIGTAQDSGDR